MALGRYKYRVQIFKPRGGGKFQVIAFDKAMKIDKLGTVKYRMYKHDKVVAASKPIQTSVDENGRDLLILTQLSDDTFAPVTFKLDQESKGILESDGAESAKFWSSQERRRTQERYGKQSALERYGPIIGLMFIAIILAFVAVYGFNTWNKLADANLQITSEYAKITLQLGEIIARQGGAVQSAQPVLGTPAGPIGQ